MITTQKLSLFLLRVTIGWMFFYAGITKVVDPTWSSAGYLKGAQVLQGFYGWLASPGMISITDALNEWGLTLIGLALIFGIAVRLAGFLGAILMLLYWLPLGFPHPNEHSLIVDEHVIYMAALFVLATLRAGRAWGLSNRFPRLERVLG